MVPANQPASRLAIDDDRAGDRIPAKPASLRSLDLRAFPDDMSGMSGTSTLEAPSPEATLFGVVTQVQPSIAQLAKVFGAYLDTHPAKPRDLPGLQAALIRRGTAAQMQILERANSPLLGTAQVEKELGIRRQSVNERKKNGQLLAIAFAGRRGDFFPAFQFDGSAVWSWIPQLLERVSEGWAALSFLSAPRKELNGQSHLQRIQAGAADSIEAMLEDAEAYRS